MLAEVFGWNNVPLTQSYRDELAKTALTPILLLACSLMVAWALWALSIRPHIPPQSIRIEATIGVLARVVFWGVPCGIYLKKYWGTRFYEPLGVLFPLGRTQVYRTIGVVALVSALLMVGTAAQMGKSVAALLQLLADNSEIALGAPLFEELVFRGILVSELINWSRDSSRSLTELRLKFWVGQLGAAVIFVAMHWPAWIAHYGLDAACEMSVSVFTTGFILGFVFANTRSIWGCVFLHWLNNQLSFVG